jgi:hypothetical protein
MKEFKLKKTVSICLETHRLGSFESDIKESDYKIAFYFFEVFQLEIKRSNTFKGTLPFFNTIS